MSGIGDDALGAGASANETISRLRAEIDRLTWRHDELRDAADYLRGRVETLTVVRDEAIRRINAVATQRDKHAAHAMTLLAERDEARATWRADVDRFALAVGYPAGSDYGDVLGKIDEIIRERDEARARVAELEAARDEARRERDEVRDLLAEQYKQVEEWSFEIDALKAVRDEARARVASLEAEVAKAARLDEVVARLTEERDASRARLTGLWSSALFPSEARARVVAELRAEAARLTVEAGKADGEDESIYEARNCLRYAADWLAGRTT